MPQKKASSASRAAKGQTPQPSRRKSSTKSQSSAKSKPAADPKRQPAIGKAASQRIDERIGELGDWRGETLAQMRALIHRADPEVVEEWKWMGTPVWSHDGIICTGESYAKVVKLTFAQGAALPDPASLFNSSLEGSTRRAIDLHEGDRVNARAFQALVKSAVALNRAKATKPMRVSGKARPPATQKQPGRILAGGNPQIAKAEGNAPVQAYIARMPDSKREIGRRIDELIVRNVPRVRKAVKWNSPFYGIEGKGWFLAFHVFTRYVKVTFFKGTSLRPVPPGGTGKDARWIDIGELASLDESQLCKWIKQAAALPGWGK